MSDIFDHEFDAFEPVLDDPSLLNGCVTSRYKPKEHERISRKDFKDIIGRELSISSSSELLYKYKVPWPEGFSSWEYCQLIAYKIKIGELKRK